MAFAWQCPYCAHHAMIDHRNHSISNHVFDMGNKEGHTTLQTEVVTCPNPECEEFTIVARTYDFVTIGGYVDTSGHPRREWTLRPDSMAKPLPSYVPKQIVGDYEEACRIRDLSPKASATLARRCLQGMIRDFHCVKAGNLAKEIESIQDKVDPVTWDSINAVRKVGNIGAHMEKDIDVIVEVEPEEAGLLIGLIESLIDDWYVARHLRAERHAAIQALAAQKEAARKGGAAQVAAQPTS